MSSRIAVDHTFFVRCHPWCCIFQPFCHNFALLLVFAEPGPPAAGPRFYGCRWARVGCTHGPWKKVLGFKFTCTPATVSMSAEHTIETMYNTYLVHLTTYDARLTGRDVQLSAGEVPLAGDPRRAAYLEMQTETRSLLGLLLWVSLAYPQISYSVNKACGFMSNP